MAIADLKTMKDAAVAAILAGDNATALLNLRAIRAALTITPDIRHAEEQVSFRVVDIDLMIKDLSRAQSGAAGIQQIPITYARTEDSE